MFWSFFFSKIKQSVKLSKLTTLGVYSYEAIRKIIACLTTGDKTNFLKSHLEHLSLSRWRQRTKIEPLTHGRGRHRCGESNLALLFKDTTTTSSQHNNSNVILELIRVWRKRNISNVDRVSSLKAKASSLFSNWKWKGSDMALSYNAG